MELRGVIRVISGAGAAAGLPTYLAAVGVNAQVSGDGSWWPYPWLWVLAAAWMIVAALWLFLSIQEGGTGPAFTLRPGGETFVMLRRSRRRTAFEVTHGAGTIGSTGMIGLWSGAASLGDMAHNEERRVEVAGSPTVWFAWIDGRRLRSRHIAVPPPAKGAKIYGTDKPTISE